MERILVIGCPGSGKSCFARKLAAITRYPLHHLDLLYWNADQTTVGENVFRARLEGILRTPLWIIDGNYASTLPLRLERCDTVFLLDYPVQTCIRGVEMRMNRPRPDLPWIENTRDEEFLEFIRRFPEDVLPGIYTLLESHPEKQCHIFRSRSEADSFLRKTEEASSP